MTSALAVLGTAALAVLALVQPVSSANIVCVSDATRFRRGSRRLPATRI